MHCIHPNTSSPLPLTPAHTQGISLEEAEEKLLTILKQVMEEKLTSTNVEVSRNGSAYFLQITAL